MSLYDNVVNSTDIAHDGAEETGNKLTPGQTALITILSTFVFFMTVMFIVCIGEMCQYNKRGKKKVSVPRTRRHAGQTESGAQSASQLDSISHSALTSTSRNTNKPPHHQNSYTKTFENAQKYNKLKEEVTFSKVSNQDQGNIDDLATPDMTADDRFGESSDSVIVDCDTVCEPIECDTGSSSIPLISRTSDDTLADGEILCDSSDSRDLYRLEADV